MAKIFRSSVINAPIDEVWARIRDFNALPDWHPANQDVPKPRIQVSNRKQANRIKRIIASLIIFF